MPVRTISIGEYKYGIVDIIEPRSIKRGAASSAKNWLTRGDRIELRPGQKFIGTSSLQTGLGRATGIKRTTDALGVQHLFGTYGKKLKYFDNSTEEWVESGSDLLGSNVVDSNGIGLEPIFMSEYVGPAGNQLWINSPHSAGFFKIMVANPADAVDQYLNTKNFKGNIKIDTNRTFLFNRNSAASSIDKTSIDKTGVYGSYIDTQTYTAVAAEVIAAPSGILAFKGGGTRRTCFGVTMTVGGITYTDDFAGNLNGTDGTVGTINYATGAFVLPVTGAGTADYQWEDATNNGIADFSKSGTRTAGQGFIFRQDEGGGPIQAINIYNTVYYCMHIEKTWALTLSADDTAATNLPYRQNVGIPNPLASCETGSGIYYIDSRNADDVKLRVLRYSTGGAQQVIPVAISNSINLNSYVFDQSCAIEYGDFILFACATKDSKMTVDGEDFTVNNRVLVYNTIWKSMDVLDYNVSCFEVFNNILLSGDAISNNFIELLSGFDDLGSTIDNSWVGNMDLLDIEGLKKSKKLYLEGNIAPDQSMSVYLSLDNGPFVEIGGSDEAVADEFSVSEAVVDSYSETNRSGDSTELYSSASPNFIGQTFSNVTKSNLSKVKLYLSKIGLPTGTLTAKIYDITGTSGTDGKPTGTVLATSNPLDASTLTTSPTLTDFTFPTAITLQAGASYCLALDATSVSGASGKGVLWGRDTTAPSHAGNEFLSSNGGTTFSTVTSVDLCFYVYGYPLVTAAYTLHHPAIEGSGSYVDTSTPSNLGAEVLGTQTLGGEEAATIYHYERLFNVDAGKFEYAQIKYVANGIGYLSVSNQKYWDVRFKGRRVPQKYRG